jgi:antitoxin YefM
VGAVKLTRKRRRLFAQIDISVDLYHISHKSLREIIMRTVMFSKARNELASLLDEVSQDRVAVEIVRRDKPSAILIDKDEYEGMMETLHLLSTPANAARLMEAVENVDAGRYEEHDLIEPEDFAKGAR